MCWIQGANTRIPHRPQTTDGTTARRSITYTIGCAHRCGTTSVRSRAMPTLTGTASTSAITPVMAVPYMKASAPNWLAVGFQVLEKIFAPSAENHDEACWLVETAIRTRITSTSRPAASARTWKPRSPSGRRSDRARADPAGIAGSACATLLTVTNRSDPPASPCSLLAADLGELRLGLLVDVGGQRRVAQTGERLLAGSEQVADVRLEHLRRALARLSLVDQVPRLIGDRVRAGAGRPDRAERQVGRDGDLAGGRGGRRRRGRDVAAGLVLDKSEGQRGGLSGGVVHVPDGPGGGLDDLRHAAVAVAGVAGGGPLDSRAAAESPCAPRRLHQELGEVGGGAGRVGADGEGDRGAGQGDAGVVRRDLRVVPGRDLALEDARDHRRRQLQRLAEAGQVVRQRDRADYDGEVKHRLALEVRRLSGGDRRVRARVVDHPRGQVRAPLARAAAAVVDRHAGLDRLESGDGLLLEGELERRSAPVQRAREGGAAARR